MLDAERLRLQFEKLDERVTQLDGIVRVGRAKFLSDATLQAAAERQLQVSIQSCLDIGNHLIAELQLRRPTTYTQVFVILGEAGVLPVEFASEVARMAGFRNRLVHLYDEVSSADLYDILQERLGDFAEFARHVIHYVESAGTP